MQQSEAKVDAFAVKVIPALLGEIAFEWRAISPYARNIRANILGALFHKTLAGNYVSWSNAVHVRMDRQT